MKKFKEEFTYYPKSIMDNGIIFFNYLKNVLDIHLETTNDAILLWFCILGHEELDFCTFEEYLHNGKDVKNIIFKYINSYLD